jgi:hypothetical protein
MIELADLRLALIVFSISSGVQFAEARFIPIEARNIVRRPTLVNKDFT